MKAAALLLCVAGAAQAQFKDGNKLLEEMSGSTTIQMAALGYVAGVADTLNGASVCLPSNVTVGQLHDIVQRYLRNNPSVRHFAADILINRVLESLWPCAKKGNSL